MFFKQLFLLVAVSLSVLLQAGTFDFESNTSFNNPDVNQTVDGVTLQITTDDGDFSILGDAGGVAGTSNNAVFFESNSGVFNTNLTTITFTFDQAVDITSMRIGEIEDDVSTLVFTPSSGSVYSKDVDTTGETYSPADWSGVTSFTVTKQGGGVFKDFIIDTIVFSIHGGGGGADTTPDAFSFTDKTDVALSTLQTSNQITVTGIDAATAITITGGTYSINSGAYTSNAGTVSVGDTVTLQHTSSGSNATTVDTTLTIGGVSDTFSSTTLAAANAAPTINAIADITKSINFADINISIGGIADSDSDDLNITVETSSSAIIGAVKTWDNNLSSGTYTGASFNITLSSVADQKGDTTVTVRLNDGSVEVTESFVVSVLDDRPDTFSFAPKTNQARSTPIVSDAVTINGIDNGIAISVSGGAGAEYNVANSGWTSNAGTIDNGQSVAVRVTSSENYSTQTTASLTIGSVTQDFAVTTLAPPPPPPVNGSCGSSNGLTDLLSTPNSNLCSVGLASTVSGDTTYRWSCSGSNGGSTANCSASKATYTVEFSDASGDYPQIVFHGSAAIAPANAKCEVGREFSGWSKEFSNITEDTNVFAICKTIDGECGSSHNRTDLTAVPESDLCTSGEAVNFFANGSNFSWSCYGGGDGFIDKCSATLVKYNVSFTNDKGETLNTQDVVHGGSAEAPTDACSEEGYTLEKWDTDFSEVTSNLEVQAVCALTLKANDDIIEVDRPDYNSRSANFWVDINPDLLGNDIGEDLKIVASTGSYYYQINAYQKTFSQEDSFTYTIEDKYGNKDTATVIVRYKNSPPTAPEINTPRAMVYMAGSSKVVNITASDLDGDKLTWEISENPEWISLQSSTGNAIKVKIDAKAEGAPSTQFRVSVRDGVNDPVSTLVTIKVGALLATRADELRTSGPLFNTQIPQIPVQNSSNTNFIPCSTSNEVSLATATLLLCNSFNKLELVTPKILDRSVLQNRNIALRGVAENISITENFVNDDGDDINNSYNFYEAQLSEEALEGVIQRSLTRNLENINLGTMTQLVKSYDNGIASIEQNSTRTLSVVSNYPGLYSYFFKEGIVYLQQNLKGIETALALLDSSGATYAGVDFSFGNEYSLSSSMQDMKYEFYEDSFVADVEEILDELYKRKIVYADKDALSISTLELNSTFELSREINATLSGLFIDVNETAITLNTPECSFIDGSSAKATVSQTADNNLTINLVRSANGERKVIRFSNSDIEKVSISGGEASLNLNENNQTTLDFNSGESASIEMILESTFKEFSFEETQE